MTVPLRAFSRCVDTVLSRPRQPSDSVASMITLRPGAEVESAISTLRDLAREVTSLTNAESPYKRLDDWRVWTSQASRRARAILPERELQRVVLGPRFDSLFSMDQTTRSAPTVAAAIDTELQIRIEELNDAARELEREWERWHSGQATAIVLDTNVLMQFGPRLRLVNWHDRVAELGYLTPVVVLIPIQVVEELDVQKDRGADNSKRAAARAVLRWLDDSFPLGTPAVRLRGDGVPRDEGAWLQVWVDDNDRVPLPRPDADIIDRVLGLRSFVQRVLLLSQDRSMQLRARSLGIDARHVGKSLVPEEPSTDA
jgi:hypothetical protein